MFYIEKQGNSLVGKLNYCGDDKLPNEFIEVTEEEYDLLEVPYDIGVEDFNIQRILLEQSLIPPKENDMIIIQEKIASLERDNIDLTLTSAQNRVETIEIISSLNEMQKLEQAQSNTELIELMMLMIGGI